MPVLPMPTLDHVVVNVRDRLDEACATYQRLGFTMTPRGHHTLGSMNHLAIFGTEYLELIAAQPGDARRAEILDAPLGLNGLVFGTDDSAAVYAALEAAGVPSEPPLQFSRPVVLPSGKRDATFRTVRLKPGVIAAGRIYFCHHFTRDLVWRDEWRHHANGVVGVMRAVIAAQDPAALGAVFARMFGAAAVRSDGWRVLARGRPVAFRYRLPGDAGFRIRTGRAGRGRAPPVHGGADLAHALPGYRGRRARRRRHGDRGP